MIVTWGMIWRFMLVMLLTVIAAGIARVVFDGLAEILVELGILMIPLYLANRARSK